MYLPGSACTTDSQVTIGRRGCCRTPLEHGRGEGEGEKKESTPRCPIKNPLCLPGERNDEQLGEKRIVNAAHLIRAAFNVKSDAPGVVFSLSIATLRGYSAQDGEKVSPR